MEHSGVKNCAICKVAFTPTIPLFILCVNCRGKIPTIKSLPEEQRPIIVKGVKTDPETIEILKKCNSLTYRIKLLQIDFANLIKEHALLSADVRKKSTVNWNGDIAECSNSLSDFENDSDDDSDGDSDDESDDESDDDSQVVHKIIKSI